MKSLFKYILKGLCCSLLAFSSLQGAGWSPIVTVSNIDDLGENSQYTPLTPHLAANSLLVTWTDSGDLNAAFLSPLGVLSTPVVVASDAFAPFSSVNPATGDAVVVWGDQFNNNVLASIYTASSNTWGAPQTLDNTGLFQNPVQVSFSSTGVAVATWETNDFSSINNYNASTLSGGVWTGPVTLAIPANTLATGLASPKNGAFAAAYWVDMSSNFVVNRFSGGAWSVVHSEASPIINIVKGGPIVIDNTGFIAVAIRFDESGADKFAAWGTGETAAVNISNVDTSDMTLAVDNAGRAYAVWRTPSFFDPSNTIHASNFLFAQPTGWSSDVNFSAPISFIQSVSADALGHLYVGFVDIASDSIQNEATYTASTSPVSAGSWAPAITVSDTTGFYVNGSIAANPSGVSLISWAIGDGDGGLTGLQEVHKPATGSFTPFFTITNVNAAGGFTNSFVSDAGNKAITFPIFSRQDGNSILMTVYIDDVPPPVVGPNPPTNFIGQGGKNKFLTQTERFNGLTWTASTTPTVVNYILFRNGELIAVIPATGPLLYVDHNRNKHVTDTYTLYAVDASGAQSAPATVVVR